MTGDVKATDHVDVTGPPDGPRPDQAPTIDEHLDRLRATYRRIDARAASAAVAEGALLVDIRPLRQRAEEGEVPGAVIVERNVLEWRLAPGSDHRLPLPEDPDRLVIVMCSAGYASTLAAVSLRTLGLRRATDLIGGFQAWRAAGLPTVDHGAASPAEGAPSTSRD